MSTASPKGYSTPVQHAQMDLFRFGSVVSSVLSHFGGDKTGGNTDEEGTQVDGAFLDGFLGDVELTQEGTMPGGNTDEEGTQDDGFLLVHMTENEGEDGWVDIRVNVRFVPTNGPTNVSTNVPTNVAMNVASPSND